LKPSAKATRARERGEGLTKVKYWKRRHAEMRVAMKDLIKWERKAEL